MENVIVTIENVVKSGHWNDFCSSYGYSKYSVSHYIDELAEFEIALEDALFWKILFKE